MKTIAELKSKKRSKLWRIVYVVLFVLAYMLIFSDVFTSCADSKIKVCTTLGGKLLFIMLAIIIAFLLFELLRRIYYYFSLWSFNPPRK
jgi:hypothetical protein